MLNNINTILIAAAATALLAACSTSKDDRFSASAVEAQKEAAAMSQPAPQVQSSTPPLAEKLPQKAKDMIKVHYAEQKVFDVKEVEDGEEQKYEVILDDGTKINFNAKTGEWHDVSNDANGVVQSLLPANVAALLKDKYKEVKVSKLQNDGKEFTIKLDNDEELKFDKNGNIKK